MPFMLFGMNAPELELLDPTNFANLVFDMHVYIRAMSGESPIETHFEPILTGTIIPHQGCVRVAYPQDLCVSQRNRNKIVSMPDPCLWSYKQGEGQACFLFDEISKRRSRYTHDIDVTSAQHERIFFDYNGQGKVAYALTGIKNKKYRSQLFVLQPSSDYSDWQLCPKLQKAPCSMGCITSLMMQEDDRLVCCVDRHQENSKQSINRNANKKNHAMSIMNIQADGVVKQIARVNWDKHIEKTVYLGKKTYLGLTVQGELIVFWLTEDNIIQYAEQKCSFIIKDIAVDATVKSSTGFMPRIAFLEKSYGDLYITDISLLPGTSLEYVCRIPRVKNAERFMYDDGICSVVYGQSSLIEGVNQPHYTGMYACKDDFPFIYARALAKNHSLLHVAADDRATN